MSNAYKFGNLILIDDLEKGFTMVSPDDHKMFFDPTQEQMLLEWILNKKGLKLAVSKTRDDSK